MDCANNWRCVVTTGNKTTKNRQLVSVKRLLSLHDKNVVYLDTCASCVFFFFLPFSFLLTTCMYDSQQP